MDIKIIAIDDEKDFLESIRRGLFTSGFRALVMVSDPLKALGLFKEGGKFDIALIDITMPGMNGMELLLEIKKISPETECIMITAVDDVKNAVQAIKNGAYDYLLKPMARDDLVFALTRAQERIRLYQIINLGKNISDCALKKPDAFRDIITVSSGFKRVLKETELHAASKIPILITGESGTGKELLARAIHAASPRSKDTFFPVNMSSVSPGLFDAEFFGHLKGAFTGAERDREGYLEHTSSGTLFLDEIGTMPLDLQGKILRVLQEGEYIKIGENRTRKTDARFIAATNENLEVLIKKGAFRKDLYYRLKVGWIHLPPLRERKEDIPHLSRFFIKTMDLKSSLKIETDTMEMLMNYSYPGNIRELKSIIHSAVNLNSGSSLLAQTLPSYIRKISPLRKSEIREPDRKQKTLAEIEKEHVKNTYRECAKNKSQTAKVLDVALNTLRKKLKDYGLD